MGVGRRGAYSFVASVEILFILWLMCYRFHGKIVGQSSGGPFIFQNMSKGFNLVFFGIGTIALLYSTPMRKRDRIPIEEVSVKSRNKCSEKSRPFFLRKNVFVCFPIFLSYVSQCLWAVNPCSNHAKKARSKILALPPALTQVSINRSYFCR